MAKTYKGQIREVGLCRDCGERFDDYNGRNHRKYLCQKCFNYRNKMQARKGALSLDVYFKNILRAIKNNYQRNRYDNDIDFDYIMELYELQEGKCALSGIEMTLGYDDNHIEEDKQYRKPFNISIDRINPERGYVKDNVVFICNIVNFFKGSYDTDTVYEVANKIVENPKLFENTRELIHTKLVNENYYN